MSRFHSSPPAFWIASARPGNVVDLLASLSCWYFFPTDHRISHFPGQFLISETWKRFQPCFLAYFSLEVSIVKAGDNTPSLAIEIICWDGMLKDRGTVMWIALG